jgi:hypothetical protein
MFPMAIFTLGYRVNGYGYRGGGGSEGGGKGGYSPGVCVYVFVGLTTLRLITITMAATLYRELYHILKYTPFSRPICIDVSIEYLCSTLS